MRAPLKSESDAFRFTLGGAAVVLVSVLIGWLIAPLVGVALLALAVLAGAVAYVQVGRRDRPPVLRDALRAQRAAAPGTGPRHVLVIANEALAGAKLRERIVGGGGGQVEVDVIAPVLTTHLHYGVSDIDRELDDAQARLQRSLQWARNEGIVARGKVGDPDPTTAIADELRHFGADEVIVVTHPRDRETWQERGELERLRQELDIPIAHLTATG